MDLNDRQRTACAKHAGAARYAYNWGLARKMAAYAAGEKMPAAIDLHRELNALKRSDLGGMYEVSKCAPPEALRNLDHAYAHFFRRVRLKKAGKLSGRVGFPKFKSKKRGPGGFRLTGRIHVFEKHVQLPRLGVLRLKEASYLPTEKVKILSATVTEGAGRWFVSVQVEMAVPDPTPSDQPIVGGDLGIKALATVSDGETFENPNALQRHLAKVKRLQRTVSRRQQGSRNRRKAARRLARAHRRVANIRRDALHKATTRLAKTKSVIGIEDLHVNGMLQNPRLARAIADVGMGEFRRQLEYKAAWYGCRLVVADRFFPSSKTCSRSGHVKDSLDLNERTFVCDACGFTCDRDLNAALNLEAYARTTVSSTGSDACGEGVRPGFRAVLVKAGTEHLLGLS